jgi:hypothetical protein
MIIPLSNLKEFFGKKPFGVSLGKRLERLVVPDFIDALERKYRWKD